VELHGENQGAIALAKDNKFHSRTKHILPRFHYVRECVRLGSCDWITSLQARCSQTY
jgi:hypothetical protein